MEALVYVTRIYSFTASISDPADVRVRTLSFFFFFFPHHFYFSAQLVYINKRFYPQQYSGLAMVTRVVPSPPLYLLHFYRS